MENDKFAVYANELDLTIFVLVTVVQRILKEPWMLRL